MFVCVYIYICLCIYIYIYVYRTALFDPFDALFLQCILFAFWCKCVFGHRCGGLAHLPAGAQVSVARARFRAGLGGCKNTFAQSTRWLQKHVCAVLFPGLGGTFALNVHDFCIIPAFFFTRRAWLRKTNAVHFSLCAAQYLCIIFSCLHCSPRMIRVVMIVFVCILFIVCFFDLSCSRV